MSTTAPRFLLIETTSQVCSVGLGAGPEILHVEDSDQPYSHNTTLATAITSVLRHQGWSPSDLTAIIVSAGPGSYTGLRVGISTAKAMCFALGIPMIAVETLHAVALASSGALGIDAIYCANIDARRMEVYMAVFDSSLNRLSNDEATVIGKDTFDRLTQAGNKVVFCGTGTSKCTEVLEGSGVILHSVELSAALLAAPGFARYEQQTFADIAEFKPIYIKAPNITVSASSRR